MRVVRVRGRHFNGRQPSGLNRLRDESSAGGWGVVWDKNTSARLCAKIAGGVLMCEGVYLWDTTVHT